MQENTHVPNEVKGIGWEKKYVDQNPDENIFSNKHIYWIFHTIYMDDSTKIDSIGASYKSSKHNFFSYMHQQK